MQRASTEQKGSDKESIVLTRAKTEHPKEEKSFVFNKQYRTSAKIQSTPSVDTYLGIDIITKQQVALKVEKANARDQILFNEARMLNSLRAKDNEEAAGIPKVLWMGTEEHDNHQLNVLAMELTGPSLGLLLQTRTQNFSLKTTLMLADQMIKRIEYVHNKGYLHRDIKPHNFAIGLLEKSSTVYLVNYTNSKQFKNSKTGVHKAYAENKQMVGSANFASINCHLGIEPSRRDDLESLGYTLVYLAKGSLPWQNTQGSSKNEKIAKIMDKKISIPPELLCKGLPEGFSAYLNYCKGLKYDEKPDYRFIRDLFRRVMAEKEYIFDNCFDWIDQSMNSDNLVYEYGNMSISFKRPSSGTGDTMIMSTSPQPFERSRILVGSRLESDAFSQQSDEASLGLPGDLSISVTPSEKLFPSKEAIMPMGIRNDKGQLQRYFTEGNEEYKGREGERMKALAAMKKMKTYENRSFDDDKKFVPMTTDSTNKTISLRIPEWVDRDRTTVVFMTEEEDNQNNNNSSSDPEFSEKESDKDTISHKVTFGKEVKEPKSEEEIKPSKIGRAMTMGKPGYEDKKIVKRATTVMRANTLYSKDSDNKEFEEEYYPEFQSRESRDFESEPKSQGEEENQKTCSLF